MTKGADNGDDSERAFEAALAADTRPTEVIETQPVSVVAEAAAPAKPVATPSRITEHSVSGVMVKRSSSHAPAPLGTPEEQERDRRLLLTAGEAVITEKGFARSSVEDVSARAGLEPSVFYAHFAGMGALLRALSEQFVLQMQTATESSTKSGIWTGAPARDVIEVAVRTIIDVVVDRRGLIRAFLSHGATDEALMIDLRKIGSHMAQRLVAVLAECTNVPTRPSRAVAFSLLVGVALAHHWILVGDEWSGVSFSKEQLAEEASQAICAYLGLKPTISIVDNQRPDLARTGVLPVDTPIEHLKTDECVAIDDDEPPPTR